MRSLTRSFFPLSREQGFFSEATVLTGTAPFARSHLLTFVNLLLPVLENLGNCRRIVLNDSLILEHRQRRDTDYGKMPSDL
jgi:hypothetical protein